jgi:S-adenosylmethionine hydrolase
MIEPLITQGSYDFAEIAVNHASAAGLLASKPDDRMEMEEIIIVWN